METQERAFAAKLLAGDALFDRDIASTVGTAPSTLYGRKLDESFVKLVNDAVVGYSRTVIVAGYALKPRRWKLRGCHRLAIVPSRDKSP
jgi:hypothetical protein